MSLIGHLGSSTNQLQTNCFFQTQLFIFYCVFFFYPTLISNPYLISPRVFYTAKSFKNGTYFSTDSVFLLTLSVFTWMRFSRLNSTLTSSRNPYLCRVGLVAPNLHCYCNLQYLQHINHNCLLTCCFFHIHLSTPLKQKVFCFVFLYL